LSVPVYEELGARRASALQTKCLTTNLLASLAMAARAFSTRFIMDFSLRKSMLDERARISRQYGSPIL
jgi:hypothetical protein